MEKNAKKLNTLQVKCKAEIAGELWATSHSQVTNISFSMRVAIPAFVAHCRQYLPPALYGQMTDISINIDFIIFNCICGFNIYII